MNLSRVFNSLLFKIIVAIILGVVCSLFFPDWAGRVFATLNGLFSNFLGFFVPVLIFSLIAPAIASLGRGAGKWLGVTAGIAYVSTVISGLIAYGVAEGTYPSLLGNESMIEAEDIDAGALEPFFSVEMDPPLGVMSALLLAFTVGIAMASMRTEILYKLSLIHI